MQSIRLRPQPMIQPRPKVAPASLPPTTGNSAKLLVDAGEIFPEMVRMIQGAQSRVQMDIFLFGGKVGDQLADALIKRMKDSPGQVKVRIMYDPGMGFVGEMKKSMQATIARLKAAGADIQPYPMDKLPQNKGIGANAGQIDHNKLLVVDGKSMVIGGMNWTTVGEANRDLMIRLDGPAAHQQAQVLDQEWALTGKKSFDRELPKPAATGDATVELTMTAGDRQDTKQRLLKLFNEAKSSIYVGMYQFDDREVAQALVAAHKRGLDVKVLLARNEKYGKYVPVVGNLMNGMPNRAIANELEAAGVPVHWYDPRQDAEEMHGKYAVVDHQVVALGSTNYTEKAFSIIRESEAFIHAPKVAQEVEQRMFLEDWDKRSTPVPAPKGWQKAMGKAIETLRDTKRAWW